MIIPQDYSRGNYKLIAVDLSKEKSLDADQQTVFQVLAGVRLRLYTVLEKSKESVLEFFELTAKVF